MELMKRVNCSGNHSGRFGVAMMSVHMRIRTIGSAQFGSLCLILMLIQMAVRNTPLGLPVQIAYEGKYCESGPITVAHVLENGNVRVLNNGVQDLKRSELADRLREVFNLQKTGGFCGNPDAGHRAGALLGDTLLPARGTCAKAA
jgi:hypothetical protein